MSTYHTPVLLKETLEFLNIKKDHWYIDLTLGGGGHTEEILKKGGKVIGIDQDEEAIKEVAKNHSLTIEVFKNHIEAYSNNLILFHSNFSNLNETIESIKNSLIENNDLEILSSIKPLTFSGILFDLGVSSHQFDEAKRGFAFSKDAPLDMRMDPTHQTVKASDLINGLYERELIDLFENWGEENQSKKIAKKIVEQRKLKPIQTTKELAELISHTIHTKEKIHPATRVFQALRIAVNDELNALKQALPQALDLLAPHGRLVVISFHSLEDRIVKNFFKSVCHPDGVPDGTPEGSKDLIPQAKILTKKPIEPTLDEQYDNPRSRSSKLRAIEKIK